MRIYVFGNGNLSFKEFVEHYVLPPEIYLGCAHCMHKVEFILCDYRGVDTLMMEYLKTRTANVTVFHIGKEPRYFPSFWKTHAEDWKTIGGFDSDQERDDAAIEACTHFLAHDINSDEKHKSGTKKNMEKCVELGKVRIHDISSCIESGKVRL